MLIYALRINAGFSVSCALLILVFMDQLNLEIHLGTFYLYALSVVLILFSATLIAISLSPDWSIKAGLTIAIADLLWVIATFAFALVFSSGFSSTGWLLIALVNGFVLTFALVQFKGVYLFRQQ